MNPCNDCPFIKENELQGSPDWLRDVFDRFRSGYLKHTCHKTDPVADGYIGGKSRDCQGLKLLRKGDPRAYKSIPDLVMAYVLHWNKTGLIDLSKIPLPVPFAKPDKTKPKVEGEIDATRND